MAEGIKNMVAIHPLETAVNQRSHLHSLICAGSIRHASKMIDEARTMCSHECDEKLKDQFLTCDSLGFSPIHSAVCLLGTDSDINIALDATSLLLLSGADVSHGDTFGNTALHWAARSGNSEVIQLLAMHGCPLGK